MRDPVPEPKEGHMDLGCSFSGLRFLLGKLVTRYDGAPLALLAEWLRVLGFEVDIVSSALSQLRAQVVVKDWFLYFGVAWVLDPWYIKGVLSCVMSVLR